MAMKPKKVSSAAKKPVKRMRGGGMVAMKKGGAVGAAAGSAAGRAMSLKGIQASMRSLAKELGMLGAGAGAGAGSPKSRKSDPNKPDKKMRGRAKTKGRGPT